MPTLPDPLVYLWEYFLELQSTRQNYGWGPVAFTYAEILAWQTLRHVSLDHWELEAILKLDSLYLQQAAKQNKASDNGD